MKFISIALLALAAVASAQDDVDDTNNNGGNNNGGNNNNNNNNNNNAGGNPAFNKCIQEQCHGDTTNVDCAAMCAGNPNPNPQMIAQTHDCYINCEKQFTDAGQRGSCYQQCNKANYNPSGVIVSEGHPVAEGVSSSVPAPDTTAQSSNTEASSSDAQTTESSSSAESSSAESSSAESSAESSASESSTAKSNSTEESGSEESGSDESESNNEESSSSEKSGAARLTVSGVAAFAGALAVALL